MKRFLLISISSLAIALLAGCGSGAGSRSSGSGTGTLNLLLTDSPADYDHVYIDVREVWIRSSLDTVDDTPDTVGVLLGMRDDDDDDHGDKDRDRDHGDDDGTWIRLEVTPMIVDLLTLQNGVFMVLASQQVPAGRYDEIRLVLGGQNSIVVDSVTYDLKVPSGQSSGFKLKGEFEVPVGGNVDVGIDFDAARSIKQTGNGKYILKPVARIYPIMTTGSIAGEVEPDDFASQVFAIVATDTVASAITDSEGRFKITLLPAGAYRVSVVPTSEAYADTSLDNVVVTPGNTTSLGTIVLTAKPPAPLALR